MSKEITKETDVLLDVQYELDKLVQCIQAVDIQCDEKDSLIERIEDCKYYCLSFIGYMLSKNLKESKGQSI